MSKRILISLSIIGIVAAIAIAGTVAYFQDVETSAGNTLSAGVLELEIRDQDEDWRDGVTATWVAEDAKPGDEWNFNVPFVGLRKLGTVNADHLEITCDYSVIEEMFQIESDTDPNTHLNPGKMAKEMIVTNCAYFNGGWWWPINCLTGIQDGNPPRDDWQIEDKDGDGKITFYDLKNDELDNLPPPVADSDTWFKMSVKFDPIAGNDFQGDVFDLTMIFTLNQDASQ